MNLNRHDRRAEAAQQRRRARQARRPNDPATLLANVPTWRERARDEERLTFNFGPWFVQLSCLLPGAPPSNEQNEYVFAMLDNSGAPHLVELLKHTYRILLERRAAWHLTAAFVSLDRAEPSRTDRAWLAHLVRALGAPERPTHEGARPAEGIHWVWSEAA